ncbi:hypothetical protein EV186_11233 [Labedaea rhizosphaerae]|uniref:Uncharacterized protein n=1 Tax=Labedaea rhizosphaerae TaxID=598644 RepID=A0A4R6RS18_LABRH|nr:hypothetical protein EV186_11233 [Labedaea rhizosphaerae]
MTAPGGLRKAPPNKLQAYYETVNLEMLYNAEGRKG